MNALRTGIDAESQVIRGEHPADVLSLQWEYYDRFRPTTPEQRMLVDSLIDAEWLLRRFRSCEAQLWGEHMQRTAHCTVVGEAFRHNADAFSRLQRRVDATHRNYRNALHELQRLQAEEESLATPEEQTQNPENGFVPQPYPETPVQSSVDAALTPFSQGDSPVDRKNSRL
ncbi:MAG: hypothetical protein WDO73_15000 [Ignavibacteriota bacterium]